MRKNIFQIAQESMPLLSAEQVLIERLKRENRALKMQTVQQNRSVATEGFFDFFKKKPATTTHAPVTAEKEQTYMERLTEAHKSLRNVSAFTDAGVKRLEGNKRTYFSFFASKQALKAHMLDLLHVVDFVQTSCENTVKAYDAMRAAGMAYAETEDRAALFQAHKKYLKVSELPTVSGFKKESDPIQTKDLFQSLVFAPGQYVSKSEALVLGVVQLAHKPLKDEQLQEVADYDFPMLSYGADFQYHSPKPVSQDYAVEVSKADLVELHTLLDKACTRTLALLAKYDHKHNPIESYVDEFTGVMMVTGEHHNKKFNTNGFYRAEENYYRGRYLYVLLDLALVLDIHVDAFNEWVHLYEPDPNDGKDN